MSYLDHQGAGNGAAARWVGVGRSSASDARAAGSAAIGSALVGPDPKLVVVFCSGAYELPELLAGIRAVSQAPLIGCSTSGEITRDGPGDEGVVVTVFGGDDFSVRTSMARGISERLRVSGADVAQAASSVAQKEHSVLMLLSDPLAGDQQEILRGAYRVLGAAVPLVGGCAGDDMKMQSTAQLYEDQVLTDAVVAAAISSSAPIGIGVHHGWRRVGDPMLVSSSSNNRVFTLDDEPALDRYLELLDAPKEVREDSAAFTRFAMTHPLGLNRRSGEAHVRLIAEADFEDRSLGCIAEVPQGGLAWLMEGDHASVMDATDAACTDALQALQGQPPLGVVAFDCIARRGVLGDEGIRDEVDRIASHAGPAPLAGFYTYGEIARTSGIGGFHNQTLVVLAVA